MVRCDTFLFIAAVSSCRSSWYGLEMRWITVLILLITTTIANAIDDQTFKFTNFAPSPVNFHDIYTNTLALLADEPSMNTKDDFHISNVPTQFVEFQLPTKTDTSASTSIPKTSDSSQSAEVATEDITSTSTVPTTVKVEKELNPEDAAPKILQRGVLDLLLPAYRVKSFKNVFDTFRKVLSYTFKK